MFPLSRQTLMAALLLVLAASQARAAELVTLRSGFTVNCTTHEPLDEKMVRLHLAVNHADGNKADNYMDVPLASIATVEAAPDEAPAPTVTSGFNKSTTKVDTTSLVATSGAKHNVNTALLASVVQAESAGNPHAVSRTGAQGLMQLMPKTAAQLGVHDAFAPADNVDGGSAYLDSLLTRYHDNLPLALAAYNAGPAAVDRYHGIPPFRETQQYVARVIREFNKRVTAEAQAARRTSAAITMSASR
jgi:soluble lytic murein transglycosylase-like protein